MGLEQCYDLNPLIEILTIIKTYSVNARYTHNPHLLDIVSEPIPMYFSIKSLKRIRTTYAPVIYRGSNNENTRRIINRPVVQTLVRRRKQIVIIIEHARRVRFLRSSIFSRRRSSYTVSRNLIDWSVFWRTSARFNLASRATSNSSG